MAEHFVNEGYGWACRRCRESRGASSEGSAASSLPRFFREGEAEEGGPRLSEDALARWKDGGRSTLVCPRCGAEEDIA